MPVKRQKVRIVQRDHASCPYRLERQSLYNEDQNLVNSRVGGLPTDPGQLWREFFRETL